MQDGRGEGAGLRYPVLDALRGLAALGVVFHHIPANAGLSAAGFDANFGRMVDLFFVLSGFVIAASYGAKLSSGFSISRFLWLRWGRVWPLHATMLVVLAVAMLALGLARPDLRTHGLMAGANDPADLPLAVLLLQGIVPSRGPTWNHPSWSISVEMLLYVLAALGWRLLGDRAWGAWLGAALALLAFAGFGPGFDGLASNIARGVAGFGLGVLVHRALGQSRPRLNLHAATALELAALATLAWVLSASGNLAAFDLAAAALVALAAVQRGLVSRALMFAPFQWLGTISYALYMVHIFVIGRSFDILALVQDRLGLTIAQATIGGEDVLIGPGWQADIAKLAIMALCLVIAIPFAKLIEQPARAWSRRTFGQQLPNAGN
ncbi:acyltransferase [Novosphingobium sp. MMS21-SN21R]|uniref:acyltransferase family protein n=1 Tax=Novosphingobium sp. MMS21-SN21R TaxID=2969298 RepID=UPI002887F417|nr:acyltransferase [Novosphingobium sp. MMS21-SN21R]MDT0509083.1 acyltransferase [Novosphingobium sp. MMS21-SN21R]